MKYLQNEEVVDYALFRSDSFCFSLSRREGVESGSKAARPKTVRCQVNQPCSRSAAGVSSEICVHDGILSFMLGRELCASGV